MVSLDEVGDGLVGQVGAGSERADGGQIELSRIALVRDEESALVDDQRRGGVAAAQELTQNVIESLDVFLDKLGQSGHVMRTAAGSG